MCTVCLLLPVLISPPPFFYFRRYPSPAAPVLLFCVRVCVLWVLHGPGILVPLPLSGKKHLLAHADLTGLAPFGVSLAHLFGGTDNSPSTGPPPPDLRQELERLRHRVSEYQQEVQSKTAALQQRHRSDTAGPGPQAAQAGLELQEFPRSGSPSSMISFSSASDFSSSSTTSSSPSQPPPA